MEKGLFLQFRCIFAVEFVHDGLEDAGNIFKSEAHMAGKRRLDGLTDVGIDFEVRSASVGEPNAGFVQLLFADLVGLSLLLRNKANFFLPLLRSEL